MTGTGLTIVAVCLLLGLMSLWLYSSLSDYRRWLYLLKSTAFFSIAAGQFALPAISMLGLVLLIVVAGLQCSIRFFVDFFIEKHGFCILNGKFLHF